MNPSVMIAIPSGSDWKADFGMSLAGLIASINKPLRKGKQIEMLRLWNTKGSILSRSRQTLVEKAQAEKVSHILFLDSDMVFPEWTLHRMLDLELMVVAANCATKQLPSTPTARHYDPMTVAGEQVYSNGTGKLIEEVWRVGTGVMLINMKVFDKVPSPWFDITCNETLKDYTGEDWNFCKKLQDAGIPIHIDHVLSQHIGHVGSYTFTHNDV
ncbi:MAG: hypothetical protein ACYCZR_04165 [Burkholderiales bacterium]